MKGKELFIHVVKSVVAGQKKGRPSSYGMLTEMLAKATSNILSDNELKLKREKALIVAKRKYYTRRKVPDFIKFNKERPEILEKKEKELHKLF